MEIICRQVGMKYDIVNNFAVCFKETIKLCSDSQMKRQKANLKGLLYTCGNSCLSKTDEYIYIF